MSSKKWKDTVGPHAIFSRRRSLPESKDEDAIVQWLTGPESDDTGRAVLHTKNWSSTGEKWSLCKQKRDASPYLVLHHPEGQPVAVKQNFTAVNLDTLKKDVKKTAGFLNEAELLEWRDLFDQLDEETKSTDTVVDFPLHDILANAVQNKQTANVTRAAQVPVEVSDDDMRPCKVTLTKPPGRKENNLTQNK